MIVTSVDVASSLEATAKEIAAAAVLYQKLPVHRDSLAAGLGSLMEALKYNWDRFELRRTKEASLAPQK